MKKYYCIRAIPGAGKNFLGHLLWHYHNGNDRSLIHYSPEYNEYFTTSDVIRDSGPFTVPFWSDNHWKMINTRIINSSDNYINIQHEHDWTSEANTKRQRLNRENPQYGFDNKNLSHKLIEGYYITTTTAEELDFVYKLYYIKRMFGDRPNGVFTDEKTTLNTYDNEYEIIRLIHPVGSQGELAKFEFTDIEKLINNWKKYLIFLKNENNSYPLSRFNLHYFQSYHKIDGKVRVMNKDSYLNFYEKFKEEAADTFQTYYPKLKFKKDWLDYENVLINDFNLPNVKMIPYKKLFLDQKPTNTPFDLYLDEIKEYTEKNIKLIQKIENYFGEITC